MIHNRHNTDTVGHFCRVVGCHAGLSQLSHFRHNKVFYRGRTQGPLENRRGLGQFLLLIASKFFFSFAMCACFFFFLFSPQLMYFFSHCDDYMHIFMYGFISDWIYLFNLYFFTPPPLHFSYVCPLKTRKHRILNVTPGAACRPPHNNHFLKKHGRLKSTPSFRRQSCSEETKF